MQSPHTRLTPAVEVSVSLQSDDECVRKLAELMEHRDNKNLDEIARLIGRLVVTVE